jgi:hypothetical protein
MDAKAVEDSSEIADAANAKFFGIERGLIFGSKPGFGPGHIADSTSSEDELL